MLACHNSLFTRTLTEIVLKMYVMIAYMRRFRRLRLSKLLIASTGPARAYNTRGSPKSAAFTEDTSLVGPPNVQKPPCQRGSIGMGFEWGNSHSNVLHNGVIEQGGPLVWRKEVEFTRPLCQARGSSSFLPQAESTSHYSPLGGELCPTTAEVRPS